MFGTILETNLETILGIIFGTPNIPRLTVIGGKSKTGIFKRTYGLNDGPGDYMHGYDEGMGNTYTAIQELDKMIRKHNGVQWVARKQEWKEK